MTRQYLLPAILLVSLTAQSVRAQTAVEAPLPPRLPADRIDGPPLVSAKAWAIADGKSGKLLWGAKQSEPLALASTSKIMTAWIICQLAADNPKVLEEIVTVSKRAASTRGSSASIKTGDQVPVRELLFGLLLPSGNDAAVALAEHFGPRFQAGNQPDGDAQERFVAEMNRQARQLGMTEAQYLDPHGLGNNQASARDLALLASKALHNPLFARYVQTRRHQYDVKSEKGEKRKVTWNNTNRLLGIDGYDGVKTGSTTAAGNCLVASGRRGGDHLLVVVLGCPPGDGRYIDSRNLFRWAWQQREHQAVGPTGR